MMNPLEAMMLARKANQSGGLGVQAQGAQQMTPLLQQAQMNVASPLKMEAQPARLMEMDKYKYVDSAQNRAQADKELLFRTMESRANRASNEALAAQSHQQALQLEALRQQNVMDAQDRAKRLDLENHKTKLQLEFEEKQKQSEILMQLNDKKFEPLRKPLANTFATYNRWTGSGEGSRSQARERMMKERTLREAQRTVDKSLVEAYYNQNAQALGYTPGAKINPKTPYYNEVLTQIFTSRYPEQSAQVLQLVDTELAQVDRQIYSAYNTSLEQVGRLGISLPEADPYTTPAQNTSPLQVNNINALPPLGDMGGVNPSGTPEANQGFSQGAKITTGLTAASLPFAVPAIVNSVNNEAKVDATKQKLDDGQTSKSGKKLSGTALTERRYKMFKDLSKGVDGVKPLSKAELSKMDNTQLARHINKVQEGIASKIVKKLPKSLTGKLGKGGLALILGGGIYAYMSGMSDEDREKTLEEVEKIKALEQEKQSINSTFNYGGGQYQINF